MAGRDARELYVAIIGDDRQLSKAFKNSTAEAQKFDRNMNKAARGVVAGSGAFKALGRSLAFASGGFLAGASVTNLLRQTIEQAQEAAVVQRQLAAQFDASGQNLGRYQQQIDTTVQSLSRLAGIEDDELKAAFVSAFRGTNNVASALKILTAATDVARGRNVTAAQATLALTKAYGGQTTALRRLGIQVPTTLKGLEAIAFVQEKFAGQAEAGTTNQERFAAALANFEEVLGQKLLPTLNEALDTMTKWLQNQENQKNAAHGASVSMKILGGVLKGVDFLLGESRREWDLFGKSIDQVRKTLEELGLTAAKVPGLTGPVGTPAAMFPGGRAPGTRGPIGQRTTGTSFQGQMNQLETQLAQALTTVSRADDRAILVLQKHLLERWLAHTKDWKLRRQLYQQLASVQGQITSIDDEKAQAAQDAAQKEKEAKQKERDAEQKRLETHRDHIRKMRAAWQEQLQKIREATEAVRSEFGALPFQPTPAGILGVKGQTAGGFAAAYAAQTRTFVNFYNDLARLGRRGAPAGLVEQLRAGGLDAAGTVHGLLTGRPGALRSLIRSFRERERVAQQIAHADINARHVTIHMAGSRSGATNASTRRGRQAGVPTSIGSYIGG